MKVEASGSIIKNVKSVIVPNTGHLKGINAAVTAGIVAGDPDKKLEVIARVSSEQIQQMKQFMKEVPIEIEHLAGGCTFDIIVTVYHGESYAKVRIANYHTNIVLIEKNGEVLRSEAVSDDSEDGLTDRTLLDMEHIWDFATTVDINDVKELLDQQIACNVAIAEEGLKNDYGANIGKVLLDMDGDDVRVRAKAMAAAGSDARMNGCEMPVVINSGSGNQGITTSVPVIVYAKELGVSDEMRYRAPDACQSDYHSCKDPDRPSVGLLRSGWSRCRSRCRNRIPLRRRPERSRTHGGQCAGNCFWYCL